MAEVTWLQVVAVFTIRRVSTHKEALSVVPCTAAGEERGCKAVSGSQHGRRRSENIVGCLFVNVYLEA